MSGLIQSTHKTAKGIPAGLAPGPAMQKAKMPVNTPVIHLPPQERGMEPLSFIAKKAEKRAPLVNNADNISPFP